MMEAYLGLPQRIVGIVVVTAGAFCWQGYRDSAATLETSELQLGLTPLQNGVQELMWPPSQRSMPFLAMLVLGFVALVKNTFFSSKESPEIRRVRDVKKRLLLAQMMQALRWQDADPADQEEKEEHSDDGDEEKPETKRPPSAADLFEMVYDDVEERHVTEYGIAADAEPYLSTLALFKERLAEDFEDFVKLTKLARLEANGVNISAVEGSLSNEELKRVAQFSDGSKLTDLLHLFKTKIKRAFDKGILEKRLIRDAEDCMCQLAKEQRKGMATLWPTLRSVLPMYTFAVCLMAFDASNGTIVFHSMKTLLDKVGAGEVTLEELRSSTLQTYVKFIFCVFAHLSSWAFTHKVTATFRLKVRNQIMSNIVRQDMKFFDLHPSGILQERLNNDAERLSSKMFHLPIRLVESFCRLMSCVLMLYSLDPQLFYVVAIPVPIIAIASHYIIRFMRTLEQRQRKIGEHTAANTMEVLKEIRTVRELNMEKEEANKFAASSAYRAEIEQYASALHHIILIAPLVCMMEGMRFYCVYLGGQFVAGGQLTPGQAVMAAGLAGDMTHITHSFFDIIPEIVSTLQPLGRVCDILSVTPKIEPHPGSEPKLKPHRFMGAIEFRNVNFTFPSEPLKQILFDLSWSISPGEKLGFVGGTGCGKSTSLYLIQRWYNPQSGSILLDGRDIGDYDVHHLRQHMSVVAQTTCLFSTTIRENVVYGLPQEVRDQVTDLDIELALKQANAWNFVNEFPRKLETYAGERGVKLSGGQKQRLAIARAIIRKPTITLLDEATSALDSKAEVLVQQALDKMVDDNQNGCTLIIAHRLSTLRTCDRIIIMDKGSIKESGSHAELMSIDVEKDANGKMKTGWYRDLYETQHGKDENKEQLERLKAELANTKQELAGLKEENSDLKAGAMESIKLAKARHQERQAPEIVTSLPQLLTLVRQSSQEGYGGGNKAKENKPPPPLSLKRASTHQ